VENPSASYDWLPTFTDAAGVPAPARTDGVSLLPSLTGIGKQRESLVYVEYFNNGVTPGFAEFDPDHRNRKRNQMQMIRIGDYAGVRYNVQSHEDDFEIYNVVKDPGETTDLAQHPGMDSLQKRMKAKTLQVRRPEPSAPRPYDDELMPPVVLDKSARNGVKWSAYAGEFLWIPDMRVATPVASGRAEQTDINVFESKNNGALFFEGYLRIPEDGEYTFYLSADAGALLRIHEAMVIDADYGYVSGSERKGKVRLKAGLHPFRLCYMMKTEGKSWLNFQWEGPRIARQEIPLKIFCHD
jgi:hypothetical protein